MEGMSKNIQDDKKIDGEGNKNSESVSTEKNKPSVDGSFDVQISSDNYSSEECPFYKEGNCLETVIKGKDKRNETVHDCGDQSLGTEKNNNAHSNNKVSNVIKTSNRRRNKNRSVSSNSNSDSCCSSRSIKNRNRCKNTRNRHRNGSSRDSRKRSSSRNNRTNRNRKSDSKRSESINQSSSSSITIINDSYTSNNLQHRRKIHREVQQTPVTNTQESLLKEKCTGKNQENERPVTSTSKATVAGISVTIEKPVIDKSREDVRSNFHVGATTQYALFEESESEQRQRFECELEFVQCLSNPEYLRFLANKGYFKQRAFHNYLVYLRYWTRPPYCSFINFPTALYFLEAIQQQEELSADAAHEMTTMFVQQLENPLSLTNIHFQMALHWLYFDYDRK